MVNLECCSYLIHIMDHLNSVVKTTMIYFANESPFEGDTRGAAHLCSRWHHTVLLASGNDSGWLVEPSEVSFTTWQLRPQRGFQCLTCGLSTWFLTFFTTWCLGSKNKCSVRASWKHIPVMT